MKISDMTAEEKLKFYLSKAIEFDAGNPVEFMNCLVEDDDEIEIWHHYKISLRKGDTGENYAICDGFRNTLSKSGKWIYERMPSSRTEAYIKRTRFPSYEAAFIHLEKWKEREKKRLIKAGTRTWKEFMASRKQNGQ